jgi:DNA-nicking Smr family endonuclease
MSRQDKATAGRSFAEIAGLANKAGLKLKPLEPEKNPPVPKDETKITETPEKEDEIPEEDLFQSAMDGVRRSSWRHNLHPDSQPPPVIAANPDAANHALMQAAIEGDFPETISDHPEYIEGWIGVSGKRFLPKLRDGQYSIQGQIDLHGLNQEEAQIAVEDFIVRMSRYNSCCIKIIHGRGINSPAGKPAIKDRLQRFLSTRRMSRYVVAYASAASCDGGVGAVYVLLKRSQ